MSSNLSIGNGSQGGLERTVILSSAAGNRIDGDSADVVQELSVVASIQSVSEMKKAELQGEHISPGEEQLIKAIEKANKALRGKYTTLEFSIHEQTKQIMVKVIDKETGDLIREIPPEKTLDMMAKLMEVAGILVDERR